MYAFPYAHFRCPIRRFERLEQLGERVREAEKRDRFCYLHLSTEAFFKNAFLLFFVTSFFSLDLSSLEIVTLHIL